MRARNACCGPSPSGSCAASLSRARSPIRPKFSGSSTSDAPAADACSISAPARRRFAPTSAPDVIWIAATRNVVGVVSFIALTPASLSVGPVQRIVADDCAAVAGRAPARVTTGSSQLPDTTYS